VILKLQKSLLNLALLISYYIQNGYSTHYLCPIPGEADYIHYIADLLAESNNGHHQVMVQVLDVLVLVLFIQ
jgi:23S rRNA (adenine1618-N6)-methyltransferase